MTTAKLVKGPSDLESQGTGKRREDSSSNSTENLTESHPKNGSHTSHDRPLTSSEPILPSPTNYFGFKRSGKNMTPEQRSTFEELRRIVLKRCATDPVWDAERDWLLGSPNDTSRPGSLHALVIRGRKSVIQTLEKGVQRRRDAATERGEPYPSSRTDLKTSKDCYNEEYESPKGTDTAATVRAGLYSSPLRGDNNKVDFDHSEKLGQFSSRSDSIHSDKRVFSSSHEVPAITLRPTADYRSDSDSIAVPLSDHATRVTIHSQSKAEMVNPNLPDSSHSETLTTASLPARLAKTESRPSSLQPSASSSKPASEPGYSSLMSDLLITGNFLIWTSKPNQPASVRNPVSAADVLELPPIITDTLTTRYLAYQTLSHLIKLHKDHRRPTPENLAHTCHRLKQDVEGPWAQIKDLFLQARTTYTNRKSAGLPIPSTLRVFVLPFYNLKEVNYRLSDLNRAAFSKATDLFNQRPRLNFHELSTLGIDCGLNIFGGASEIDSALDEPHQATLEARAAFERTDDAMQPVIEAGSKNPNNSSPNPVNTSYDSEAKPKETHKSVLGGSRLSEPRQMTLEAEEPFEKNDDAMKTAIEAVSENPKNRLSTPEKAIYNSEAELKETHKNTSGSSSGTTKSSSPFADDAYSFKQDPLEFLPEKHDSDGGTGSHSNSSRKGTDSPPMLPGKWPSSDFLAKNNNIGSYSTQHQTANLRLSSSLGPDAVSSQACTLSSQKFLAAEKASINSAGKVLPLNSLGLADSSQQTGDVLCSPTLNNFKTEQSLNSTPTLAQSNLPPAASARCPQSLQNHHSGLNSPVAAVLLSPASLVDNRMASTALSSQKTQNHLVHSQSPLQLNTNHMPQSPINNNFSSQSPINQNPKSQNQQLNCFYTQASCSHNPRSAMKSSITTPIISHIHHPVPTTTHKRSKFSSPTSSPLFDVQSFGQILPSDRLVSYRQSEKSLAESQHHELLDNEQRQDLNSKAAMEYYEQARSRASSAEVIRTIESSRVLLRETKAKNQAQLPGLLQNRLPTRLHGDLSKSSISIHGTTLSDMENTDATLHSATVIGFSQTTSPSQVKIYTPKGHLSSLSTSKTNSPVLGCDAPILTKTETVSASPALGGKKVRVEDSKDPRQVPANENLHEAIQSETSPSLKRKADSVLTNAATSKRRSHTIEVSKLFELGKSLDIEWGAPPAQKNSVKGPVATKIKEGLFTKPSLADYASEKSMTPENPCKFGGRVSVGGHVMNNDNHCGTKTILNPTCGSSSTRSAHTKCQSEHVSKVFLSEEEDVTCPMDLSPTSSSFSQPSLSPGVGCLISQESSHTAKIPSKKCGVYPPPLSPCASFYVSDNQDPSKEPIRETNNESVRPVAQIQQSELPLKPSQKIWNEQDSIENKETCKGKSYLDPGKSEIGATEFFDLEESEEEEGQIVERIVKDSRSRTRGNKLTTADDSRGRRLKNDFFEALKSFAKESLHVISTIENNRLC